MYCVDYQMSYPLLVVPYAPLLWILKLGKALILNGIGAFFIYLAEKKERKIIGADSQIFAKFTGENII